MEPEVLPSSSSFFDRDEKNLERLLETFGSVVSLDDIAVAYCKSGRDLNTAGNILCNLQKGTFKSSILASEEEFESKNASSMCLSEKFVDIAQNSNSKPRNLPACMGTVSSVIGKGYVVPKTSANGSSKPKPLKLNSDDFPISEIWDEKDFPNSTEGSDTMHQDIEEFLFKMLGEGFSLSMNVIKDIVGQCGYDVRKSMDKLLDLSASTLGKDDGILKVPSEKHPDLVSIQAENQFPCTSSGSLKYTIETGNIQQLPERKDKSDLQKEVLKTLFAVPERSEKEPKKCHPMKQIRRSSTHYRVVEEPLKETIIQYRPIIRRKQVNENNTEENEDSYDVLRKPVKEYWATMKEYYKAAVDAFAKEDNERAHKLMEEGHFFMKKAREADERSAEKLLESNEEEEISIDVLDFKPKEAVRILKVQLTCLAGLPSNKFLKVVVGSNEESAKSGPRKRQITQFLGREGINWEEENNGWTIVIQLDIIDPKKLSFAKKQAVIY